MRTVTLSQARRQPAALAEGAEPVLVTRHGQAFAVLRMQRPAPATHGEQMRARLRLAALAESLPGTKEPRQSGAAELQRLRERGRY